MFKWIYFCDVLGFIHQKYGYNPKNICKEPIKEASCRALASHRVSTALCEGEKKKKTRYENNHDSLGIWSYS